MSSQRKLLNQRSRKKKEKNRITIGTFRKLALGVIHGK